MAKVVSIMRRQRPPQQRRLASAARVLKRFDLQALMISAQVANPQAARTWIRAHLEAGTLEGPQPGRGRNRDAGEWRVIGPLNREVQA